MSAYYPPFISFCRWATLMAISFVALALGHAAVADEDPKGGSTQLPGDLAVMSWNIWHGGREDGEIVGPERVAEVMRASGADIIAVQETYGSGEMLAKSLGFHLHARGTNVSLLSRWPVVEDISVFEPFKCVGGIIDLPTGRRVAVYSVWLPYGDDIWLPNVRAKTPVDDWLAACKPSANDLAKIHAALEERLAGAGYEAVDIIIAGDFNSMSHLDYSAVNKDQFDEQVDWDTSRVLSQAGFRDAYREMNPIVDRATDSTWSPRFKEQEQDRIDFVYYRSTDLRCVEAENVRAHANGFPSDHAAVVARFRPHTSLIADAPFRVATYNVRHGAGADNKLDLERTAAAIRKLEASIVGLQEIDMRATRSGSVNQMRALANELGMHAAFGSFMPYGGGEYGLGILSKFPIVGSRAIRLTTGNEPRVALAVKVRLPDDRVIEFVCVHFDWVKDDGFRFQQAQELVATLKGRKSPVVIVGDFNDSRGSRTIDLFQQHYVEAVKPAGERLTWSADQPRVEIDFIFVDESSDWKISDVAVVDEPVASDHRPVIATLRLPKLAP